MQGRGVVWGCSERLPFWIGGRAVLKAGEELLLGIKAGRVAGLGMGGLAVSCLGWMRMGLLARGARWLHTAIPDMR
jgi:hypothetical protein